MKVKFYIFAVAVAMAAVFSGCKKEEPEPEWSVITDSVSEILQSSAKLQGSFTNNEIEVTEKGFFYDTAQEMYSQKKIVASNGFSIELSDLTPSTNYYYYAYATAYNKTKQGEIKMFRTLDITAPNVQTLEPTSISNTAATLNGNVTSDGGANVTERGFMYGTNANNLTHTVQSGSGTGSFSKEITGLTQSSTYYYKAYATNSEGTTYGEVKSFTPTYSFSYDFESCNAWSVDNFSPCTTYDGDGLETYAITDVEFSNEHYIGSFICFQNGIVDYFYSHRGTKFGCCMAAMNGANNDWFITPAIEISAGMKFSFWARSVTDNYGLERFKVGISRNRTSYSTYLAGSSSSSISAPTEWTQYTYDLSAYAGQTMYIAIMCVSNDVFALSIDDIYVGTNPSSKSLEINDNECKPSGKVPTKTSLK